MKKIGIVGSRSFENYEFFKAVLDSCLKREDIKNVTFISGGCYKGADNFIKIYLLDLKQHRKFSYGEKLIDYLPDYKMYPGRVAPLMRNTLIAKDCDFLIAFWDGESRGTLDTIKKTLALGKNVGVFSTKGKVA